MPGPLEKVCPLFKKSGSRAQLLSSGVSEANPSLACSHFKLLTTDLLNILKNPKHPSRNLRYGKTSRKDEEMSKKTPSLTTVFRCPIKTNSQHKKRTMNSSLPALTCVWFLLQQIRLQCKQIFCRLLFSLCGIFALVVCRAHSQHSHELTSSADMGQGLISNFPPIGQIPNLNDACVFFTLMPTKVSRCSVKRTENITHEVRS